MNKNKKSIDLLLICTGVFASLLFLMTFSGPFAVRCLCKYFKRMRLYRLLVVITYAAVPAGWGAIYSLFRLLLNLRRDIVFDKRNIRLLSVLSWLCIYVGVLSLCGSFKFAAFPPIALAAFFTGLIVRIVKGIISRAIEIKEENDMTI